MDLMQVDLSQHQVVWMKRIQLGKGKRKEKRRKKKKMKKSLIQKKNKEICQGDPKKQEKRALY